MASPSNANMTSFRPFPFKAKCAGIITSAMIHAAIILLLLLTPVTKVIPHMQIIQVSLEHQKTFLGDAPKGTDRITTSKANPAQNKVSPKALLKPVTLQREVFREQTVSEQQDTVKTVLSTEVPVVAVKHSPEIDGSINGEDTQQIKASSASKTEGRGIAETEFGGMHAPAFIHREMPVYPMLARRLGKEGMVLLKLLIDMNGKLQDVEVVEPAGFGFTEAAVAAVKNSTYAPASCNGGKIAAKALLPVRFCLQ